jgi:hemolysin activation/secretion protein
MLAPLVLALGLLAPAQPLEQIADIRVHGNTITSDEEIVRLADVTVGARVGAGTLEEIASRLRAADRFVHVEVLKRFASIDDPSKVLIVIVVDEGPVRISTSDGGLTAHVEKSRNRVMFLPLLDYEDGYGLSYGVRLAFREPAGTGSRLSFPLTWGGDKRAAVELDKALAGNRITRVRAGASLSRRKNPFYREDEDRGRVWIRAERDVGRLVRAGATAGWEGVTFFDAQDRVGQLGADVVFDTRIDPVLPRNAVYARAAWDHLAFRNEPSADRIDLEARGYIGLVGQTVLVLRALEQNSSTPLPPYLKPLLGGTKNLRGFRAGSALGDALVAGSMELRVPLTSPLSVGKGGVSAFVDVGTVYDKGERLRDRAFARGVGGGVWFSATVVRLNLTVAHGLGGSTRVQFGTSLIF